MLEASGLEAEGSTVAGGSVGVADMERRRGISDQERAGRILARAVDYLVSEQLAGRAASAQASRQAVALLCEAGRSLDRVERREPARKLIAGWLRKASLNRTGGGV